MVLGFDAAVFSQGRFQLSGFARLPLNIRGAQIERLVPPTDHHNTTHQIDPDIHGHHGLVNISLPNTAAPTDPHIIASTEELSIQFPYNVDMNSGNPLGIGTPFHVFWMSRPTHLRSVLLRMVARHDRKRHALQRVLVLHSSIPT